MMRTGWYAGQNAMELQASRSLFTLSFDRTDSESQHGASHAPKLQPLRLLVKVWLPPCVYFQARLQVCCFAAPPAYCRLIAIFPHMSRNARCRLYFQGIFSRYRCSPLHLSPVSFCYSISEKIIQLVFIPSMPQFPMLANLEDEIIRKVECVFYKFP